MRTAVDFSVSVYRQSGLRLCVLDVDGDRVLFPPAPRLVGEATERGSKILLSPSPASDLEDQILSSRNAQLHTLTTEDVAEVVENLQLGPPQPFYLARKILVLSTRIQFVEFGLQNAALTRMRARVPTDLLGLAQAADVLTRNLLRASLQLISKEDEISGDHLLKLRGAIERKYTTSLGRYGRVIRHECGADFETALMDLRVQVERFKDEARQKLQETIGRNCEAVVVRLLPVVSAKVPDRWIAFLGTRQSEAQLMARLAAEIE